MLIAALLGAAAITVGPPPAAAPATLIAAGDIASCRSGGDERTERLLRRLRGTIAVLGDSVYDRGTKGEYRRCYARSWGRHRHRTRPALGNHEYGVPRAAGYFRYFGWRAGAPPTGWYSYRLGRWRVFVLNTNCVRRVRCGKGSPQYRWLRANLRRTRTRCVLAYGHHPRYSSGPEGGSRPVQPLWRLLYEHRVELYLSGHSHNYERFDPRDARARTSWRRGVRQFVIGTGGRSHDRVLFPPRASRVRADRTFGVLVLRLYPGRYTWRFMPVAGRTFTDSGRAHCK